MKQKACVHIQRKLVFALGASLVSVTADQQLMVILLKIAQIPICNRYCPRPLHCNDPKSKKKIMVMKNYEECSCVTL